LHNNDAHLWAGFTQGLNNMGIFYYQKSGWDMKLVHMMAVNSTRPPFAYGTSYQASGFYHSTRGWFNQCDELSGSCNHKVDSFRERFVAVKRTWLEGLINGREVGSMFGVCRLDCHNPGGDEFREGAQGSSH
jgi:hypothetical protein